MHILRFYFVLGLTLIPSQLSNLTSKQKDIGYFVAEVNHSSSSGWARREQYLIFVFHIFRFCLSFHINVS